jgi:type VI secretion system protein ImpG
MDARYYQDELNYLRTLGAEYAKRFPENAELLGAGARDPDVERLLQGFAFLAGRLHERLDDQFSQVAEGYLSVLWPQVLRPTPSLVMVQFCPDRQVLRKNYTLERGLELHSKRYQWGQYKFQSCRPVSLYPFRLAEAKLEGRGDKSLLRLVFELNPGATIDESNLSSLPIYISGDDPRFTYGWFLWLTQYVRGAYLVSDADLRERSVSLSPVGFGEESLFLPSEKKIPGHRILKEFFAFPENFLFVQIDDLSVLRGMNVGKRFDLLVDFGNRIPSGPLRDISPDSFRLYCTPAINLFESTARIALDHTRSEYVLRSDELSIEHHEVFSVTNVCGIEQGSGGRQIEYRPFFECGTGAYGVADARPRYRLRFSDINMKRNNRPLKGRECFISFDDPAGSAGSMSVQTVSARITCTHRGGTAALRVGDLCEPSGKVPAFVTFSNIRVPTQHHDAPLSAENLWLLVSSFALTGKTVADIDHLKAVLAFHSRIESDSDSLGNRWLDGLTALEVTPGITAEGGTPLRRLNVVFTFDCESDRTPEFYLFGVVLSEFMRHVATINTRLHYTIQFERNRDQKCSWPQRTGTCMIL